MYVAVNECSTHTVEDESPCELMMRSQQSTEPRKRVSFAEEALLYSSPLFMDEVRELWYSQDEYAVLKEERRTAVKLLRFFGTEAVQRKVCIRGLEAYFSLETNIAMKEARETATSTVFQEQRLQRQLGYYDADALRDVYVPATQWLRDHALKLAHRDSLLVANVRQPLTQSIPTNARMSFQNTMTHQRSQKRLLQEDSQDHMDGILSKLESTLHLGKALDIASSSSSSSTRACYDEHEPVRFNRM